MNTRRTNRSALDGHTADQQTVSDTETVTQSTQSLDSHITVATELWSSAVDTDGRELFVCECRDASDDNHAQNHCSFCTPHESQMRQHVAKHESRANGLDDQKCDTDVNDGNALMSSHSYPFRCTSADCNESFDSDKLLDEHRIEAHFSDSKPVYEDLKTDIGIDGDNDVEIVTISEDLIGDSCEDILESSDSCTIIYKELFKCIAYNSCDYIAENKCDFEAHMEMHSAERSIQTGIDLTDIILEEDIAVEVPFEVCVSIDGVLTKENESNNIYSQRPKVRSVIRCSGDKITDEIIEANENYVKLRTNEGKFWYKCLWDKCNYGNINEGFVRRHVQKHAFPYKCYFLGCNQSFAEILEMAEHYQMSHTDDTPYKCDWPQCKEAFDSAVALAHHRSKHLPPPIAAPKLPKLTKEDETDSRTFDCHFGKCNMHYLTREALETHQQIHLGERPFKCLYPECTFAAKSKDKLDVHIRYHSGDKPFRCDWPTCEKSFVRREHITRHKKSHTNREELVCEFVGCDECFDSPIDLENHLRLHLGMTKKEIDDYDGANVFRCHYGFCRMCFQSQEDLNRHSESHTGDRFYKCGFGECSYAANTLEKLNAHIRYHTNERPFECEWPGCSRKFTQNHHLVKHRRTHCGFEDVEEEALRLEKTHKCSYPQCDRSYTTSFALKRHKHLHHNTGEENRELHENRNSGAKRKAIELVDESLEGNELQTKRVSGDSSSVKRNSVRKVRSVNRHD